MIDNSDVQELKKAKNILENPSLAIKISNYIGQPLEKGMENLPKKWSKKLGNITQKSLLKATDIAVSTMKDTPNTSSNNQLHKIAVGASGAAGGFFGFAGLAIELPTSTTIMLRSIMDIARENGESIEDLNTKLACLQVFALGGKSMEDDSAESSYFAIRAALAKSLTDATKHIAKNGLAEYGAPAMVRFISNISKRFGIQVGEKAAGQSVPVIGAATGAIINTLFITHFQQMAKGHFIVRRLERKYSPEIIKAEYHKI